MAGVPPIRYTRSGDVHIAYQVLGEGPADVVWVWGTLSHIELFWETPTGPWFYERLASFCRLITFDKRGTGMSDRVGAQPTLEERMDDVRAVMDAAGSERAVIVGESEGGPMAMLFAATYPERTAALDVAGVRGVDSSDRVLTENIARFGGRRVNTTGDGIVATFDGPGRAIKCACAVRDAARSFGIEVRAALHTGEIEQRGDDVSGIAVHLAARVMGQAQPGEVLVSRTVADLVAGSNVSFDDRGTHALKGIDNDWQLLAVHNGAG